MPHTALLPDPVTAIPDIASCQVSADTPYCWPPNGSRICINVDILSPSINVFWPQNYYHSDAMLQITFDSTTLLRTDVINDGKDSMVRVSWQEYDENGVLIPGLQHEKAVNMYFLERRIEGPDDEWNSSKGVLHKGPTLILVQTEDWEPLPTTADANKTNTTKAAYPFAGEISGAAALCGSVRMAWPSLWLLLLAMAMPLQMHL